MPAGLVPTGDVPINPKFARISALFTSSPHGNAHCSVSKRGAPPLVPGRQLQIDETRVRRCLVPTDPNDRMFCFALRICTSRPEPRTWQPGPIDELRSRPRLKPGSVPSSSMVGGQKRAVRYPPALTNLRNSALVTSRRPIAKASATSTRPGPARGPQARAQIPPAFRLVGREKHSV